jgi:hypothetical protein
MSVAWQQAASQVLTGRYPDGLTLDMLVMRVQERSNDEFDRGELYDWLCAKAEEGTVDQGYLMWYAGRAVMHPEGKMKGYYAYATLGDIGELALLSGKTLGAVLSLSRTRLADVSARIEAVHARIEARRDAAS